MPHRERADTPRSPRYRGEGMRGVALHSELSIGLADELNVAPLGVGAWARSTTVATWAEPSGRAWPRASPLWTRRRCTATALLRGSSARYCAGVVSRGGRS